MIVVVRMIVFVVVRLVFVTTEYAPYGAVMVHGSWTSVVDPP